MNYGAHNQVDGDIATTYKLSLSQKCTAYVFMATTSDV